MRISTLTALLFSIIISISTAYAVPFNKLSIEDKIRVRTDDMAAVMELDDQQKSKLEEFNRVKFEGFRKVWSSSIPKSEKKTKSEKIQNEWLSNVKSAFTNKKFAKWQKHLRESKK